MSPHFDDAALSCAALLARDEPIDVLTVFAGEPDPPQRRPWDALTGFADSSESLAARRAEEVAAFAGTPHRMRTLDLIEDQYLEAPPRPASHARTLREAVAGFATVAVPAGAGRRRGRLRAWIEARLRTFGGPLPHPDHEYARDAALAALAGRPEVAVLAYDELPYAFGGSGRRALEDAARAAGLRVGETVRAPVDRAAKAARIAAYASQVPHLATDRPPLDRPESLPPAETYWRLARA